MTPRRSVDGTSVSLVVLGAVIISFSSSFAKLSQSSPATVALCRCLFALPLLAVLARREAQRAQGHALNVRAVWIIRASGAAFGLDLVFWSASIREIGVGLATVLGNLQLVFVLVLLRLLFGQGLGFARGCVVCLIVGGVVLLGWSPSDGMATSGNPALGVILGVATSFFYAIFLIGLHVVRSEVGSSVVAPTRILFEATLGAAIFLLPVCLLVGGFELRSFSSVLWLICLALSSQVLGWLPIMYGSAVLPPGVSSALLLVQPAGAIVLGFLLFSEVPSLGQWFGIAAVVLGVVMFSLLYLNWEGE